ncbi:MAG: hypothetical protein KIT74_09625 [Fimbriimonadales bacterium]|nr:hypothetical protein [Fimbriimonadales bacterium]
MRTIQLHVAFAAALLAPSLSCSPARVAQQTQASEGGIEVVWSVFPDNVLVWQRGNNKLADLSGRGYSVIAWVPQLRAVALKKHPDGIFLWHDPNSDPEMLLDYRLLGSEIHFSSGPQIAISESGDVIALYFELSGELVIIDVATRSIVSQFNQSRIAALTGIPTTVCDLVRGVAINSRKGEVAISLPSNRIRDEISSTAQTETFVINYRDVTARYVGPGAPVAWVDADTLLCIFQDVLPKDDRPHGQEKEARLYRADTLIATVPHVDCVAFDGARILLTRRTVPHRVGVLEAEIRSPDLRIPYMKTQLNGISDVYRIALVR